MSFNAFIVIASLGVGLTASAENLLKRVKVDAAPLKFQESEKTTTGKTVISGPGGTRTITQDDSEKAAEILNRQTADSASDITVTGVSNPGISVETRVYDMRGGGPPVISNGPTDSQTGLQTGKTTTITGGPGSVHTESHSTLTKTPTVRVLLGR